MFGLGGGSTNVAIENQTEFIGVSAVQNLVLEIDQNKIIQEEKEKQSETVSVPQNEEN